MFHAALDLGAKGYVLKDSAIDDIVAAIKEVAAGRSFTSLPMTTYFTRRQNYNTVPNEQQLGLRQLTPTEARILKLLADYKTSKEIAGELSVSPRTIETHRLRICQKLNLHGSHSLMKFAVEYKSLL
jgi:DNA-binding NarL/FixJ family response regulator